MPYRHEGTLPIAVTIMFYCCCQVYRYLVWTLSRKRLRMTTSESDRFKLFGSIKCLDVLWKFSLYSVTFYFIQTLALPCRTHLSIRSLAPASSSAKSTPSLQPLRMLVPSHHYAVVLEGTAHLSRNVIHHMSWIGFWRLCLGVSNSQFPPCIPPWPTN